MTAGDMLVLDAGTSGIRCLIFDFQGRLKGSCRRDYRYVYPAEAAPLGREFAAEELWQSVCECIHGALKTSPTANGDIVGISAVSQREGAAFLDKDGREIYLGPSIDLRAVMEGLALDNRWAVEIHSLTGHLPSLMFVPARLKWFQHNRPELYDRIATVLSLADWLIYRLCGARTGEICGMVELGMADVRRRCYSSELAARLEFPETILPPLVVSGSPAGRVTVRAAGETGIAAGTPVIQGAPDSQCGLLAMGVKDQNRVGIVSGWSTSLQMVTGSPVFDAERRIWTGSHIVTDRWILESNTGESGHALEWVGKNIFKNNNSSNEEMYRLIDSRAASAPTGAEGVLAFTGPEAMDSGNLSLRWGGFIFPIPFSAGNIDSAHLARAALENIAFAVRANAEQLEAVSGQMIREVSLGGGLSRSLCLKKSLPAVLGRPVGFAQITETSGLGAAMLAAAGAGIYSSLDEAIENMQSPLEIEEPDRLSAAEYYEYYQRWLKIGRRLKELGEELN